MDNIATLKRALGAARRDRHAAYKARARGDKSRWCQEAARDVRTLRIRLILAELAEERENQ